LRDFLGCGSCGVSNGCGRECQRYIYPGRVLLGNLKQRMQLGGIGYGETDLTLPDGVKLHAQSNMIGLADIDEVWIDMFIDNVASEYTPYCLVSLNNKIKFTEDIYFPNNDLILFGYEPDGVEGLMSGSLQFTQAGKDFWIKLGSSIANPALVPEHYDATVLTLTALGEIEPLRNEPKTTSLMATLSAASDYDYLTSLKFRYISNFPETSGIFKADTANEYNYLDHIVIDSVGRTYQTTFKIGYSKENVFVTTETFRAFMGVSERTIKSTVIPGWYIFKVSLAQLSSIPDNTPVAIRLTLGLPAGKHLVKDFEVIIPRWDSGPAATHFWQGALLVNVETGEYKYYDGSTPVLTTLHSNSIPVWSDISTITVNPTEAGSVQEP